MDKLELDLQRHRDVLWGVLSRISTFSGEVDDLRVQVLSPVPSAVDVSAATVPLTQCDS